ncbi:MAG: hypothetical protein LBU80_08020, partial [Rikenellaceae bacterium]|nr:hypothetical protein [Rikenellaceae bacterium]
RDRAATILKKANKSFGAGTIEKMPSFVMSYLTYETPQEAEIRTVAKSLPDLSESPSNCLQL